MKFTILAIFTCSVVVSIFTLLWNGSLELFHLAILKLYPLEHNVPFFSLPLISGNHHPLSVSINVTTFDTSHKWDHTALSAESLLDSGGTACRGTPHRGSDLCGSETKHATFCLCFLSQACLTHPVPFMSHIQISICFDAPRPVTSNTMWPKLSSSSYSISSLFFVIRVACPREPHHHSSRYTRQEAEVVPDSSSLLVAK